MAAQVKHGTFRVSKAEAIKFADDIRVLKAVDPTLGLYAAYAYRDGGDIDQVCDLLGFMLGDLKGHPLLDVALLARGGPKGCSPDITKAVPFCPMLMRGWSMFLAESTVPSVVREAAEHLVPALWTTFDDEGMRLLGEAMNTGELS